MPVRRILALSDDPARHVEFRVAIHIDVAVAFEMADHRHPRLGLHARHQALAAARHQHVDELPACRRASRRPRRDRRSAPVEWRRPAMPPPCRPCDQAGVDRGAGAPAVGATAQNRRVAGLQAQRAGIGGHVRPALVDDADHAQRHAHAADAQAVRARPLRDRRCRSGRPARRSSSSPRAIASTRAASSLSRSSSARAQARGLRFAHVLGIGRQDRGRLRAHRGGSRAAAPGSWLPVSASASRSAAAPRRVRCSASACARRIGRRGSAIDVTAPVMVSPRSAPGRSGAADCVRRPIIMLQNDQIVTMYQFLAAAKPQHAPRSRCSCGP